MAERTDLHGAAEILGVTYQTALKYRREHGKGGKEPRFPTVDRDGTYSALAIERFGAALEKLRAGDRPTPAQVAELAQILGRQVATVRKYVLKAERGEIEPLPRPSRHGLYSETAVSKWAARLPGSGMPGTPRPKGEYPCETCGSMVKRRITDLLTGLKLCRVCYVAADPGATSLGASGHLNEGER